MGQGQVKMPQSFPAIFKLPLPWFSMCLVAINLWLISGLRETQRTPQQETVQSNSQKPKDTERIFSPKGERKKKFVTKQGSSERLELISYMKPRKQEARHI